MPEASLFELIVTVIFLLFGAGFLSVSRLKSSNASSSWLAMCFFSAATVSLLEFMRHAMPILVYVPATNGLYALTAVCFAAGMTLRAEQSPPYRVYVALGIITTLSVCVMAAMGVPVWMLALVAHIGVAMIFGLGVWGMRSRRKNGADRLIIAMCTLQVVQLLVQPFMVWVFADWPETFAQYHASVFLQTFQLVGGIIAVITAMVLLYSYASELINAFREQASHDKLTGVLNRHGFDDQLSDVLQTAELTHKRVGVILLDLDFFKAINDGYGHYFGDEVISRFGNLLGAHAKGKGIVARLGGEEFAYVLPVENLAEARATASLLRERWERCELKFEDSLVPCTASLGVVVRYDREPLRNALMRADEALYLAKGEGRNRVRTQEDVAVAKLKGAAQQMRAHDQGRQDEFGFPDDRLPEQGQ